LQQVGLLNLRQRITICGRDTCHSRIDCLMVITIIAKLNHFVDQKQKGLKV
jgi:hypothetical protein